MGLLEKIQDTLRPEDKLLLPFLDLQKTDDEIVEALVTAGMLDFGNTHNNEDQDVQ